MLSRMVDKTRCTELGDMEYTYIRYKIITKLYTNNIPRSVPIPNSTKLLGHNQALLRKEKIYLCWPTNYHYTFYN